MTQFSVSFDAGALRNAALRWERSIGYLSSEALLQQSVNRAGRRQQAALAKDIQAFLPVKLKYIRRRIRFRQADKTGVQARLRIYGRGTGGSAWIRPRHAKPKYSTERPARKAGLKGAQLRAATRRNTISFGVGGPYLPRQDVPRGFITVVGKGRRFSTPWSSYFQTNEHKANIFQRRGAQRLPIDMVSGVTVGRVAQERGLTDGVGEAWQREALSEYLRRVELELQRRMGGQP